MSSIESDSLTYHQYPKPGKIAINVTKPIGNQYELTLAYSPGVSVPVTEIDKDQNNAYKYTAKGNLVGIISNGTAILGLGNLGALASKPVMEGKAALFKILADIDAFDIEIAEQDPQEFIKIVTAISPTFGAINLEDIKAPECFIIEEGLQNIGIPVIHDDQHGTAIVLAAGLLNACDLQGIAIASAKVVVYGAGAAAIASVKLLYQLGFDKNNIIVLDSKGVLNHERQDLTEYKKSVAADHKAKTLLEAMQDANILIGLAGAKIPEPELALTAMQANPITFLLSNPEPEISVTTVAKIRPDAIIATGRSDLANQINNALCFPYLFKGALKAQAKCVTMAMKIAAVHAIKDLARQQIPKAIITEYDLDPQLTYGKQYIVPKITDQRLCDLVTNAVSIASQEHLT